MTMLWVFFALMTALAVLSLLWPLARQPAAASARDKAKSFYRDQIDEIGRDRARGLLGEAEAQVAEAEAGRRLLHAAEDASAPRTLSLAARRTIACAILVGVPLLALGLYLRIGNPDLPDQPLAARLSADPAHLDMAAAVARIEAHLATQPDDGRAYEILAPVYLRNGRMDDAVHARREAIRLLGDAADRESMLGEALVFKDEGRISDEARKVFEAAVKLDAKDPAARFYLGLAAAQAGDVGKARTVWTALLADAPPDAPYAPGVRARLAGLDPQGTIAAPPPDAAAAVAALPADAQRQAIHGMVDGLAQRLAANGNDPDGWLRLVRAYKVLGEGDKAADALRDARRTLANDSAALERLTTLAHELGLEG